MSQATLKHSARSSLNPKQKEAIEATEGRVLVLAGAGSGKTSVLTQRIAHLIKVKGVPAEAILGLTFTNKAAKEMRERLKGMVAHKEATGVTLSTFHSFCCKILRQEIHHLGYTRSFTIYDEIDRKRLLKHVAHDYLEHEGELPSIEPIHDAINQAKNRGLSPDAFVGDEMTKTLFTHLESAMRAFNAVDFDALLSLTVRLFEEHSEILAKYQDKFRYILIDEYQDTNPIQYKIASLLASKHNNLFVVGDDDQSIYGFRGAEIKHILEFESDLIIKLEHNYRSTPIILAAANAVIRNNKSRHDKELKSTQETGEKIAVFHAPTDEEEAKAIVKRIVEMKQELGYEWRDFAILYRSNNLARPFELALMEATWKKEESWVRGIPYAVYGGLEMAQRSEIKDLIGYLKAIANRHDEEAILRIINVPRRGISNQALDHLTQFCRKEERPLWQVLEAVVHTPEKVEEVMAALSKPAKKGIDSFVTLLEESEKAFETEPLHEALDTLIEAANIKKAIEEEVKDEKVRQFKFDNVLSCVDLMMHYEAEEENATLVDFLSNTLLDPQASSLKEKKQSENRISLMTFHSAKGLEFKACFLAAIEDNLLPHEKSIGEQGIEEERRLFYVALTRAKKHLTLSMARKRKKMGKETNTNPSRFLFEIPQELLQVTTHSSSV